MSVLLACMCITWVQEHSEPRKCIRCGPGVTDGCENQTQVLCKSAGTSTAESSLAPQMEPLGPYQTL